MQIGQVLFMLFTFSFALAQSVKVIYVNLEETQFETHQTGIIIVPEEKPKCKGGRTPDRTGNCRRVVEF
jgi:hypothetical protein